GIGTQIFSFLSENINQYITIFFGFLTLFVIVRAPNGLIELQTAQNRVVKERFLALARRLGLRLRPRERVVAAPLDGLAVVPSPALPPIELVASNVAVSF